MRCHDFKNTTAGPNNYHIVSEPNKRFREFQQIMKKNKSSFSLVAFQEQVEASKMVTLLIVMTVLKEQTVLMATPVTSYDYYQ